MKQERTPRRARGKRPRYFDDPAMDQTHAILLAAITEISVLFDRFDSIERILDAKGTLSRADIENWQPDDVARRERTVKREALIRRLLRSVRNESSALQDEN